MSHPKFTRSEITDSMASRFRRFAGLPKPEAACWLWRASTVRRGYGQFSVFIGGRRRKIKAHRFAYLLYVGEIPDGMFVCHTCDNPTCVNPAHLFLGTARTNNRDTHVKGRHIYGRSHHKAKLTPEQIREIRAEYRPYVRGHSLPALAKKYGVSAQSIRAVISRTTWKEVD